MADRQSQSFLKPAAVLTLTIFVGWLICLYPASLLRGQSGVLWMSVAAICCLLPGWIVVFLSGLSVFPNDLAAMLVQMTVRLVTVGGAAVVVKQLRPGFGVADFAGWLIGFYLLALFVEVYLVRKATSSRQQMSEKSEVQSS